ncbi:phosphotransferase family protein [Streptomyces sp. NPDC054784]
MQQDDAPGPTALTTALAGLVRADCGGHGAPHPGPPGRATDPLVLADRADGTVVRLGDTVAKAHAPDCDAAELALRLRIAAHPDLAGVLLPPLPPGMVARLDDGRAATLWPYGVPVDPDAPDDAPWEAAGTLLAHLHAVRPDALRRSLGCGPLPTARGPLKAARAVERMRAALAAPAPTPAPVYARPPEPAPAHAATPHAVAAHLVERVWAGLPAWCRAEAGAGPPRTDVPPAYALCHGDFHLGQLVRAPAPYGPWRLIDVDDLGTGDPVWDLARPAAWFAAGVLPPDAWQRLLHAYRYASAERGGAPWADDPWPRLDAPARALTAQTAATAVAKAVAEVRPFDAYEEALVSACARIAAIPEHGRGDGRTLVRPARRTPGKRTPRR